MTTYPFDKQIDEGIFILESILKQEKATVHIFFQRIEGKDNNGYSRGDDP
jgi:hypothetical protein